MTGTPTRNPPCFECRRLSPEWEGPLAEFFRLLRETGDNDYFHPHPFDDEEAEKRAHYTGKDLYYILVEGERVLGYGMLRGWDEGYEIPSLGIAVRPSARGTGLGLAFMHFLHAAARRLGAERVRLKVHPGNAKAVKLYEELGYSFGSEEAEQLVGIVDL